MELKSYKNFNGNKLVSLKNGDYVTYIDNTSDPKSDEYSGTGKLIFENGAWRIESMNKIYKFDADKLDKLIYQEMILVNSNEHFKHIKTPEQVEAEKREAEKIYQESRYYDSQNADWSGGKRSRRKSRISRKSRKSRKSRR